jgi:hypothetical protein
MADIPLGSIRKQVEQRVVVEQEVLRVPVLGPDHVWALDRVAAEENGLESLAMHRREGEGAKEGCTKFNPTIS